MAKKTFEFEVSMTTTLNVEAFCEEEANIIVNDLSFEELADLLKKRLTGCRDSTTKKIVCKNKNG